MKEYNIGDIVNIEEYTNAALWCTDNKSTLIEIESSSKDRLFKIVEIQKHIPTYEEQRQNRAEAYRIEKDPITCQILSLREEEQTEEVIAEIEQLKQERSAIVEEIKQRYPYPEENDNQTSE